jgi:hypothetical protein
LAHEFPGNWPFASFEDEPIASGTVGQVQFVNFVCGSIFFVFRHLQMSMLTTAILLLM